MSLRTKFNYMATGRPYNDADPRLDAVRDLATLKTNNINNENDHAKKEVLIKELFGSTGKHPFVNPNFRCEFGQNIHVGDNFYANYDCTILDGAPVYIGNNVLFGPKVGLYTSNHLFDPEERKAGGCVAHSIGIGDNVWLGAGVTVTPDTIIGHNSIIGAGSVVVDDIPDGVIAAGNPCKVIRKITRADRTGFDPDSGKFL